MIPKNHKFISDTYFNAKTNFKKILRYLEAHTKFRRKKIKKQKFAIKFITFKSCLISEINK